MHVLYRAVSYTHLNGQNLRPELTGEGPFIQAVQLLYQTDTSTNIFPSIHVFNAVACCVALLNNKKCRQNKIFTAGNIVLTVSIVLSTMFLKQHSVEDVVTALILNVICYQTVSYTHLLLCRRLLRSHASDPGNGRQGTSGW